MANVVIKKDKSKAQTQESVKRRSRSSTPVDERIKKEIKQVFDKARLVESKP